MLGLEIWSPVILDWNKIFLYGEIVIFNGLDFKSDPTVTRESEFLNLWDSADSCSHHLNLRCTVLRLFNRIQKPQKICFLFQFFFI